MKLSGNVEAILPNGLNGPEMIVRSDNPEHPGRYVVQLLTPGSRVLFDVLPDGSAKFEGISKVTLANDAAFSMPGRQQ